jgi:DNA-damage-inducible protein J
MATVATQIRIDEKTKKEAVELLDGLGLNLSDAVNIFLRQIILQGGIPFAIKYPQPKPELTEAMEEAVQISRDTGRKKYTDVHQMFEEILEDGTEG